MIKVCYWIQSMNSDCYPVVRQHSKQWIHWMISFSQRIVTIRSVSNVNRIQHVAIKRGLTRFLRPLHGTHGCTNMFNIQTIQTIFPNHKSQNHSTHRRVWIFTGRYFLQSTRQRYLAEEILSINSSADFFKFAI